MANLRISFKAPGILVKVGRPAAKFYVIPVLLCSTSDYFRTALKQEWREGKRRLVELSEDNPDTFNAYMNWLHSRHVVLWFAEGRIQEKTILSLHSSMHMRLVISFSTRTSRTR